MGLWMDAVYLVDGIYAFIISVVFLVKHTCFVDDPIGLCTSFGLERAGFRTNYQRPLYRSEWGSGGNW